VGRQRLQSLDLFWSFLSLPARPAMALWAQLWGTVFNDNLLLPTYSWSSMVSAALTPFWVLKAGDGDIGHGRGGGELRVESLVFPQSSTGLHSIRIATASL
jgi:hypothetical protein